MSRNEIIDVKKDDSRKLVRDSPAEKDFHHGRSAIPKGRGRAPFLEFLGYDASLYRGASRRNLGKEQVYLRS